MPAMSRQSGGNLSVLKGGICHGRGIGQVKETEPLARVTATGPAKESLAEGSTPAGLWSLVAEPLLGFYTSGC